MFLSFANFNWQFIQGISKIVRPLTSILRINNLLENLLTSVCIAKKDKVVGGSGSSKMNKNLFKPQKLKFFTILSHVSVNAKNTKFSNFNASTTFTQLRQAFIKASIFRHFNLKYDIRIETNTLGYTINRMLNQLILKSVQWHPIAYFSKNMILAKTSYKTYNSKLLAIVKTFKI